MTYFTHPRWLFTALLLIATVSYAAENLYIGQEKRAIKALSEQEVSDYMNGRGMGTSKAAELNHYPGPKHVMDDAAKLGLSADQINKTRQIYTAMASDATRVGKEIVHKEAELEALYAHQQASADNTRILVTSLAALQADFRLIHLNAHLGMRDVLSPQQVASYDRLRGYDGSQSDDAAHKKHH